MSKSEKPPITLEEYKALLLLGFKQCCHCLGPTTRTMTHHCNKCLYYDTEDGRLHHEGPCLEVMRHQPYLSEFPLDGAAVHHG